MGGYFWRPCCGLRATGSLWRDLPPGFGNWNTVFKRFRHRVKADVFKRIFDVVSDEADMEFAMIDGTIVRVHRHGQGAKGGLRGPTQTYVDLNRSGVALMEIVSKPDLRSAEEAGLFVRKVRTILRYLGTCDGNMEQGSLRCDVNISVRHPGDALGTRAEIKKH